MTTEGMEGADKPFDAVMESADFSPAYEGEQYVTVTLRMHKDQRIYAGVYSLKWARQLVERPEWSLERAALKKAGVE